MRYGTFEEAVRGLNAAGTTFATMAYKADQARSQVWFNNIANGNRGVSAPPPDILTNIAKSLDITADQCAALVADGWYGVRTEEQSPRVRRLAPAIDALDDSDAAMVERLITRLVAE